MIYTAPDFVSLLAQDARQRMSGNLSLSEINQVNNSQNRTSVKHSQDAMSEISSAEKSFPKWKK